MRKILRVKPFITQTFYVLIVTGALVGIFVTNIKKSLNQIPEKFQYVWSIIGDKDIKVVGESQAIIKPYNNDKIIVSKNYYDYESDNDSQEKSILYYGGTYIQNTGIDYMLAEAFDVISILEGVINNIYEDELFGNVVEIKHDNNLISVYQSLSEVKVKKGDAIVQGEIIGISGTNSISGDDNYYLHFELFYNGNVVNPELYYNKIIEDL